MAVAIDKNTRWPLVRLGDVCEIVGGSTPSKSNPAFWKTQDVSWFTVDDIRSQGRFITSTAKYVSTQAVVSTSLKIIPSESVLICCTASVGEYALTGIPLTTNQQFNGLVIKNNQILNPKYLFYFASSIKFLLLKLSGQTTVAFVSQDKLKTVLIPLPPLAEQQRMVARLDAAFAAIAEASAAAEANLRNARALFDSYLDQVFSTRGAGWVERRLGDVCERLTNGFVGPTRDIYQTNGIPYLLARHVKNNRLNFDGKTFVSEEFNQRNKKSILKCGDLLLVQSGHIGHTAVVTKEHEGHNCHAMIVITPVDSVFIGNYLSLYFLSPEMKRKIDSIRSGSTIPHLTCGEIRELKIRFPSIATQQEIISHAENLEYEVNLLSEIYKQKLTALTELKQALLAEVFGAGA